MAERFDPERLMWRSNVMGNYPMYEANMNCMTECMRWRKGVPCGGFRVQFPDRAYGSGIALFLSAVIEKH